MMSTINHSGFVALIGRPNVGKSTLLNALIGEKISIVSPKPQTTRWQILGIKTLTHAQIIYIDTPGMHQEQKRAMNRYLNRLAMGIIQETDVLVMVVDAQRFHKEDELVLEQLKSCTKPVILALNKIDLLADKTLLLSRIDEWRQKFSFTDIVPISAKKHDQVDTLEKVIAALLPEGLLLFPETQVTDKSLQFQIGEIIREKLILVTEEELPYATTVVIERVQQQDNVMHIHALIWVERDGQKAIVIGKKGERLKKIGTLARKEIEKLVDQKVFLKIWVKVKGNWTDDEKALSSLGYE